MAESNGTANPHADTAGMPLRLFSALHQRAELAQRLGLMFDGRRNLHELLGYKPNLQYLDLKARYLRQHIAHRIVRLYPEATWAQPPTIREDNETETDSPFEAAWTALEERLHIFSILERLDVMANLGEYGCLLIGLKGQADLKLPATAVSSPEDILYLTPYSQEFAQVVELEKRPELPTFGQPLLYEFTFGRGSSLAGMGPTVPSLHGLVHASRVLHVVDDVLDDEVYGIPRLLPVFDLLDDIYKVAGGSAEQFWIDAKKRMIFSLRDEYKMSPEDEAALAAEVEEFVHELRSYVRVQGMDVNAIPGNVASPEPHMRILMMLIGATLGIPQRKLAGSEAGHLASTQDEHDWLQKVQRRNINVGEQRILRPLIDKLLLLHALPPPTKPYVVDWANLLSLSEEQQAPVVRDYATAMNQAATAGDLASVIALSRTLVEALGYDPEDPILAEPQEPMLAAPAPAPAPDGAPGDGPHPEL